MKKKLNKGQCDDKLPEPLYLPCKEGVYMKRAFVYQSTIEGTFEEFLQIKRFMDEQENHWPIQIMELDYKPMLNRITITEMRLEI